MFTPHREAKLLVVSDLTEQNISDQHYLFSLACTDDNTILRKDTIDSSVKRCVLCCSGCYRVCVCVCVREVLPLKEIGQD